MQDDGTLAALQERWGLTSDASEDADEGGDAGVDANGTGDGADGAGGDAGAGAGADAVSYTHLDVYKRQVLYSGERKSGAGGRMRESSGKDGVR